MIVNQVVIINCQLPQRTVDGGNTLTRKLRRLESTSNDATLVMVDCIPPEWCRQIIDWSGDWIYSAIVLQDSIAFDDANLEALICICVVGWIRHEKWEKKVLLSTEVNLGDAAKPPSAQV